MTTILDTFAIKIKEDILGLDKEKLRIALRSQRDLDSLTAFYACQAELGDDFLSYEPETIQIALLKERVVPATIQKIIQLRALVSDIDGVLSVPQYFNLFTELVTEDETDARTFGFIEPAKIIWAIVLLKAIYNSINIPVSGDVVRYIVACLKSDGWTLPPLLLDTTKFSGYFEYYEQSYYDTLKCSQKQLLTHCGKNSSKLPNNAAENFYEQHKPIMQYLFAKTQAFQETIKKLS